MTVTGRHISVLEFGNNCGVEFIFKPFYFVGYFICVNDYISRDKASVIKVKASLFDDYKKDVYWSLYGEQIVADE